ncbi:hypothetical protein AZ18_0280, partial [Bordetella bronchiseptica D993]
QLPERVRWSDGQREVFQTLQRNRGEALPAPAPADRRTWLAA